MNIVTVKLDKQDLKILYELDKNSRQSYSQLSKKIHLSQETIRYKINRLIDKKVISHFFTVVNVARLGITIFKILLKLQNISKEKKEEIISYLKEKKEVIWIVDVDGNYDLALTIGIKDHNESKLFLSKLYELFGKYIHKRSLSINLQGEYLTRDYLVSKERSSGKNISYKSSFQKKSFDKIDEKILTQITKNSRISVLKLSKKINLTPEATSYRLRKLEKEKIITKYNIMLNHEVLNQIHYKVLIYLNNLSEEKEKKLCEYCKTIPEIVYLIKAFGEWDLELDIEVKNIRRFREIMMDLSSKFSEIIQDYSTLTIYKIHKYDLLP